HPLDTPSPLGHEIGHLALEGSQPGDGLDRAERAPKKPAAMKQLEPLTVAEVGLPPRYVVKLAGIDENDLYPPRLEQLVDGDPVYRRALHGYRLHALFGEPVGELIQLVCRRPEHPNVRFAVVSGRATHPMLRAAHVQ